MKIKFLLLPILFFFIFTRSSAQENGALIKDSSWTAHFQMTIITQAHSGFKAKYSGTNSLDDSVEHGATSITSTLFLGKKLWKGSAIYLNPELSGGRGLSYSVGVAGALNGETYRIGDPAPSLSIARLYLQQVIPLNKKNYEDIDDGTNQVKDNVASSRIVITGGKFSMADFFDQNVYSHDPRSQFMNWSLMSNGAWDYPANTKGYTFGLIAELIKPTWALRVSSVAVPSIANHPQMEYRFGKAHAETVEIEKKINIDNRKGKIRLLASYMASRAPSYQQGLDALKTTDTTLLNVISGNAEGTSFGGKKINICFNIEQELTDNISVFARAGWNDGKHATWAFTEIDQTAHIGFSLKGARWKRKDDVAGIAVVVNGISADHRAFLKAGGYGFIIGDGTLNYGHESILEIYYNAKVYNWFWISFDYQFVNNPAYNKDRGPVHVFGVRGHIEI